MKKLIRIGTYIYPLLLLILGLSFGLKPVFSQSSLPGDGNGDGRVDGLDYIIWLNHFNQTTSGGPTAGDFNRSGKVDGLDYVMWLNNFGSTASTTPIPTQPASSFNFISWSDVQGTGLTTNFPANSNNAKALGPEFTIFNGDVCSSGFTVSCTDAWQTALNGGSTPGNGMSAITFPVKGNH